MLTSVFWCCQEISGVDKRSWVLTGNPGNDERFFVLADKPKIKDAETKQAYVHKKVCRWCKMKVLLVDDELSALRDLERVMKKAVPSVDITKTDETAQAMELCKDQQFDVVFLDINMPGTNGLVLAKKIKEISPLVNIVMVTAYPQYALDAVKLYVSDYILKPAMAEDIVKAFENLRNPVKDDKKGLYVRCFGNFEVFYDSKPMHFGRSKVKEMLAYLIDRKGSSCTNAELRAILWKDDVNDSEKQRKYFAQLVYELRSWLEKYGLSDIFIQSRDAYAIVPEKINCDYYEALNHDPKAVFMFEGEYMSQYEWASMRLGTVAGELKAGY